MHRGGGVNIEVEELDGRADQAGKQHLARSIDGRLNHGVILVPGRCCRREGPRIVSQGAAI